MCGGGGLEVGGVCGGERRCVCEGGLFLCMKKLDSLQIMNLLNGNKRKISIQNYTWSADFEYLFQVVFLFPFMFVIRKRPDF